MSEREPATVPSILRPLSTDEYDAPPRTLVQQRAIGTAAAANVESAKRLATPLGRYVESRRGTATGLLAMNESVGGTRYFEVPPEAAMDDDAAAAAFAGDGPVIDVQTHALDRRPPHLEGLRAKHLRALPSDGARLVERPRRCHGVLDSGVPALRVRRGRDRARQLSAPNNG